MMKTNIEPFSEQYYILPDVDSVVWPNDRIIVPKDLYVQMVKTTGKPVLKLGNGHYRPEPENGVPAETVALPEQAEPADDEGVLLARKSAAKDLIVTDRQAQANAYP